MNRHELEIPPEAQADFNEAVSLWSAGTHKEALAKLKTLCNRWPSNLTLRMRRIVWLGDYAQGIPGSASARLRRATARRLKAILPHVPASQREMRRVLWNEINFQTYNFKRQYLMGCEEAKSGSPGGYFSMGVGAWGHGEWLRHRGKPERAQVWARKAADAWETFIALNAHRLREGHFGFYAMSLFLLGKEEEAQKQFQKARELAASPNLENVYASVEHMKWDFYRCIGLVPSGKGPF